jgi:hypothetical protein
MSFRRRQLIAWTALVAVLYSAVSPAIAAVLFADRPDVLGRMLRMPEAAQQAAFPQQQDHGDHERPYLCHEDAGNGDSLAHPRGDTGSGSHDDSEHAAHGIFCSFCLTSSSVVTLPAADSASSVMTVKAAGFVPAGDDRQPASLVSGTRHSRDPPAVLI